MTALLLTALPAEALKRRAFVTSVSGTGDLGSWADAGNATGLDAGDIICQQRASAAGLPGAGAYRAWLSTSTTDAYCRLRGQTGQASNCQGPQTAIAGPWYLANGVTQFAADLEALTDSRREIYRPVMLDEYQDELTSDTGSIYWTGSSASGSAGAGSCSGWISASAGMFGVTGNALASAIRWSEDAMATCDSDRRLLCLQIGPSETAPPGWSPGSLAFVTSSTGPGRLLDWPDGVGEISGLAAGDAICRAHADRAALPASESFFAWISTEAVDASDRLTSIGAIRRVDGFAIANSVADLTDGANANSLHVDESGRYLDSSDQVWTGTDAVGAYVGLDCGNWESVFGSGIVGYAAHARDSRWTISLNASCSHPRRLYCFSNTVTLFWDGFELTGDTTRWSSVAP